MRCFFFSLPFSLSRRKHPIDPDADTDADAELLMVVFIQIGIGIGIGIGIEISILRLKNVEIGGERAFFGFSKKSPSKFSSVSGEG